MSKILLLEDDANLNDTVTEFLEEKGYDVVSVYDGYEAQEKLYESKYDLLLLDVNTPGINGFDLLKEARENDVVAPAIFITSLDSVDDLEKGFDSGCDDYIRKPYALKELQIRVETLLKRAFYHESKELIEISKNIAYEDEVIVHERIYEHLWDFDEEPSDTALRTYIKNLRKIIGKERIVSIKKQGYKFTAEK